MWAKKAKAQSATRSEFVHYAFVNILAWCKTKAAARAVCAVASYRFDEQERHWKTSQGSHRTEAGEVFAENPRASPFNNDLLIEPTFIQIYLDGKYPKAPNYF